MMRIKFTKDAAGFKNNTIHMLDDVTARVLIHRGYAKAEKTASLPEEAPVVAPAAKPPGEPPAQPRPTASKKPATSKAKVTTAPANRKMTAKKETGPIRRAPKKNEYETKGLHAKDVDE